MSKLNATTYVKLVFGRIVTRKLNWMGEIEWQLLAKLHRYNPETANHSVHVSLIAKDLIERPLKLASGQPFTLANLLYCSGIPPERFLRASLLHDIGKTKLPRELLFKPGSHSLAERQVVEQHEVASKQILQAAGFLLEAKIAGQHHNHSNEPANCQFWLPELGKHLNVADILHFADVYEALLRERTYKQRLTPLCSLAIICHDAKAGMIGSELTWLLVKSELAKVNTSYRLRLESSSWPELLHLLTIKNFLASGVCEPKQTSNLTKFSRPFPARESSRVKYFSI